MSNENSKIDSEKPKKRGRPPLPPEERERRRIERIKLSNEIHKRTGYAARKKYEKANPDAAKQRMQRRRQIYDEVSITFPKEFRSTITQITALTGLTITEVFIGAVEEKYNVRLSND